MAKKIGFPNRACPGCGASIHIKTKQHECGWSAEAQAVAPTATVKRGGRPKKSAAKTGVGSISLDEIAAVKALVESVGAEKVQQLARVLAR